MAVAFWASRERNKLLVRRHVRGISQGPIVVMIEN